MLRQSWVQTRQARLGSSASTLGSVWNTESLGTAQLCMGGAPSAFSHQCWWLRLVAALSGTWVDGEHICIPLLRGKLHTLCRWDSDCCENEKWKASADVQSLQHGEKQTFYHVLVDARDWPADSGNAPVPVAYVAHEKLYAPQVQYNPLKKACNASQYPLLLLCYEQTFTVRCHPLHSGRLISMHSVALSTILRCSGQARGHLRKVLMASRTP